MSNTITGILGNHQTVMVRAFRDKPARLVAVSRCKGLVEVANDGEKESIRVRDSDVYAFSEDIFDKLVAAFKKSDLAGLARLWSKAAPFA